MKSRQFCSVCKQHLEMEVVPTGDGDDDGVVWFRCPQCQGFLPKLGGALEEEDGAEDTTADTPQDAATETPGPAADAPGEAGEEMPWDSPADMIASRSADAVPGGAADPAVEPAGAKKGKDDAETAKPEPIAEYAALLAELDPADAVPYRPWQTYEVGQCVHHLAWDDCGVIVAKEDLPGGRCVIKCYFSEAGVVRLIEQAPR